MGAGASVAHDSLSCSALKQAIVNQFGADYLELANKLEEDGLDGSRLSSYRRQDMNQLLNRVEATESQASNLLDMFAHLYLPVIRLIPFEKFKQQKSFPRFPGNKNLCVDAANINRQDSFIVFISHCWLRGWSGADGWDGRPHPDSANHDKFQLTVEGIEKALKYYAPGMSECYVWLDFGCMDQDGNPAGELKQLDTIVQTADCIFTPIYDNNVKERNWPTVIHNRCWCRVEMFYAANIPNCNDEQRIQKFSVGFKSHVTNGNSYFNTLNPEAGSISVETDRVIIRRLLEELRPYMKFVQEGYEGDKNKEGFRHGQGVYRYADGNVYEGEWKDDKKNGQ
eukprot:gene36820-48017_t